ncbi:MAG: deoxynucleoside kinase [Candidatus Sericytochromatia bacterium]|nr:deoxynucleoside kinase [Candidatus Sericytochromatia bacterium]
MTETAPSKRYIVVAGNIGCGKSTLTRMLAESLDAEPYFEAVDGNPYLADFYGDMTTWSFHLQVYFLSKRFEAHRQIATSPQAVVQDRSIYEDAEIFARNLHLQGLMHDRDYANYEALYHTMLRFCPPPDLVVYLQASLPTLQRRIALRGRDYEQAIPVDYLSRLNTLYDDWIGTFDRCPVLTLPADELDFVQSVADRDRVLEAIAASR